MLTRCDAGKLRRYLDREIADLRSQLESNPQGGLSERNSNNRIHKQMTPYVELLDIVNQYTRPLAKEKT